MIKQIDNISFHLKEDFDLSWVSEYGRVLQVFDEQDSGHISFTIINNNEKRFLKFAGAKTINYQGEPQTAIDLLKKSSNIYDDLKHPSLVNLCCHKQIFNGYLQVFDFIEGECLYKNLNFSKILNYCHKVSPYERFKLLSDEEKFKALDTIFTFFKHLSSKGYTAIDFYDGAIIYDFINQKTTICDIDYFHKGVFYNTIGELWGSSRFKSPEEKIIGSAVDEISNVFTLGATCFEFLGSNYTRDLSNWNSQVCLYIVAKKAIKDNREERYQTISEFIEAWNQAKKN